MSNLFNLKYKLSSLEGRLRVAQLRSQLRDLSLELSTLQDVMAEAKRLLEQAEAEINEAVLRSAHKGSKGGNGG